MHLMSPVRPAARGSSSGARPASSASSRGGGLLSQQMAEAPAGAGPLSAAQASAAVYINGHASGGPARTAGSTYEPGSRSGAHTPEDFPGTRNGSKPASPKALEAQVAKLVQGQQMLSNQLEELALQISLAQSGLGAAPRPAQQQPQQQPQQPAAGLWQQLRGVGSGSSLPPAAWAAAGALAGAAATLLLVHGRR